MTSLMLFVLSAFFGYWVASKPFRWYEMIMLLALWAIAALGILWVLKNG